MEKVIIGLSANINDDDPIANYGNVAYVESVLKSGAVPLILPVTSDEDVIDEYIKICDGFIFTGGEDISPLFYNEEPRTCARTSIILDEYQLALFHKVYASKKPFLGICRGLQLMNVALGGTLYQDISEYSKNALKHAQVSDPSDVSHSVTFATDNILHTLYGDKIYINSYHHQAINRVADDLRVIGKAPDGIIEAVEVIDHKFAIGVQWHPEKMLIKDDEMLPLFKELVKKAGA